MELFIKNTKGSLCAADTAFENSLIIFATFASRERKEI